MSENSLEIPDLRVRRSRKSLTDALCTLIRTRPLHKISVPDITEEAMVNRSTFYAHFVDKYDLFATAIGQRMRHDLATEFEDATRFTLSNLRKLLVVGCTLVTRVLDDCQRTSMAELAPVFLREMQKSFHEIVTEWVNRLDIPQSEADTLATFALKQSSPSVRILGWRVLGWIGE